MASRESLWITLILRSIKNECNKVRKIQHILSRKKHTASAYSSQPYQFGKDTNIAITVADSKMLTTQSRITGHISKNLKFGTVYTNHMLKIKYIEKYGGWQKPVITPLQEISLHPAAKVFHYAITLFEGMKAYRGVDDKIRLFRPELNMIRMNLSAERACLPQIDSDFLLRCIEQLISIDQEWVPYSTTGSLYIRPTLMATDSILGVAPANEALLYVILSPVSSYFNNSKSIKLLADPKYIRAWPGGCGDKKMGSNYAPTVYVQKMAKEQNCDQVLWLYGNNEEITEAGTMNVFLYYLNDNGEPELATAPLNGIILPGITRISVLDLAREWNEFNVVERSITMSELVKMEKEHRLLEMFGVGTACVVSPISEILYKGRTIKIPTMDHAANTLHSRISQILSDIQYGRQMHSWAPVIDIDAYNSHSELQAQQ